LFANWSWILMRSNQVLGDLRAAADDDFSNAVPWKSLSGISDKWGRQEATSRFRSVNKERMSSKRYWLIINLLDNPIGYH
jgi:hypothetical protein